MCEIGHKSKPLVHWSNRFFYSCFLLAFAMIVVQPKVLCATSAAGNVSASSSSSTSSRESAVSKFVQIPVFYVTDRDIVGDSFGAHRRYPVHCLHNMYYGTAFVTVRNDHNKTDDAVFQRLGWKSVGTKEKKFSPKDKIDPSNPEASKTAFFDLIRSVLDRSGKNELCVFAHGAADPFEECVQDAAEIAYNMEKPIVLYSWPSESRWRGYFIDASNNEWSQGHFDMFLKDLLAFREQHPLQVIAISHSMGNRLMIRALPVVYGKGLVTNWELISPDMDADTTRHYTLGMQPGNARIRLYVSNRDKLLPIAQALAGGYYRLGEAMNPSAMPPEWKGTLKPGAIERIDFTAVDHGFEGHTIPFELLANMVNTDTPGPGLQLVPESAVHAGKIVRFIDRKQKLSGVSGGLPGEFCKRVVKVK